MDLVFYIILMAVMGLVNVATGNQAGNLGPVPAEAKDTSYDELPVGNNLNGVYHKDAFLKIVKELGLL